MFEISIKLTNEEKKLIKNTPCYDEDVRVSLSDPVLKKLVDEAIEEFTGDPPDDISVTIKMVWLDS